MRKKYFVCIKCETFQEAVAPTCEICGATRPGYQQSQVRTLIFRNAAGKVYYPGQSDEKPPAGYDLVELTAKEARHLARSMTDAERARARESHRQKEAEMDAARRHAKETFNGMELSPREREMVSIALEQMRVSSLPSGEEYHNRAWE